MGIIIAFLIGMVTGVGVMALNIIFSEADRKAGEQDGNE